MLDAAQIVEAVMAGRQVVEARDARRGRPRRATSRSRRARARCTSSLKLHPRDALRASPDPTRAAARLEPECLAPPVERVGVIVEIVRAGAEEHAAPRCRCRSRRRSVGRELRRDHLGDRRVPGANVAWNCVLAYDGIGNARGGDGSHAGVPCAVRAWHVGFAEHPIGNAEARQLGVDVRARAQHDGRAPRRAPRRGIARDRARRSSRASPASGSWMRHGT